MSEDKNQKTNATQNNEYTKDTEDDGKPEIVISAEKFRANKEALDRLAGTYGLITSVADLISKLHTPFVTDPKFTRTIIEASKINMPKIEPLSNIRPFEDIQPVPIIHPRIRQVEDDLLKSSNVVIKGMKQIITNQQEYSKDLEKQLTTLKQIERKSPSKKMTFLISFASSVIAGFLLGFALFYIFPK